MATVGKFEGDLSLTSGHDATMMASWYNVYGAGVVNKDNGNLLWVS